MELAQAKEVLQKIQIRSQEEGHAVEYACTLLDQVAEMRGWMNPRDEKHIGRLPFHTLTENDIPGFLWGDNLIDDED